MSRKAEVPEVTIEHTSNLTLETRRGTYQRNETDRDLRADINTSNWPKTKRSQSAEIKQTHPAPSYEHTYRSTIKSSNGSRSRSLSPVRSVSDGSDHLGATAPSITASVDDLTTSVSELKMAQQVDIVTEKSSKPELDSFSRYQYDRQAEQNELRERIKRLEREVEDRERTLRSQAEELERRCVREEFSRSNVNDVFTTPKRITTVVSDSIIAPKPFTGKTTDEDAEGWLEYFARYSAHRHLDEESELTLFKLMMRGSAADWLSGQPGQKDEENDRAELARLMEAFADNYFRPSELRWKETGTLWGQPQRADECVQDYMIRVRQCAKRLKMEGDALYDAILHGLRPAIRMMVLSQKPEGVDALVKAARVAEAAAPVSNDKLSSLVMKLMETSTQAQEKQTAELKALNSRVAALAITQYDPRDAGVNVVETPTNEQPAQYDQQPRRQFRQTPQTRQRDNYVQNFAGRQDGGGPRSFRPPYRPQQQQQQSTQPQANGNACGRCGYAHEQGNCRANGVQCRKCLKIGHYARCCMTGRPAQN